MNRDTVILMEITDLLEGYVKSNGQGSLYDKMCDEYLSLGELSFPDDFFVLGHSIDRDTLIRLGTVFIMLRIFFSTLSSLKYNINEQERIEIVLFGDVVSVITYDIALGFVLVERVKDALMNKINMIHMGGLSALLKGEKEDLEGIFSEELLKKYYASLISVVKNS